MRRLALPLLALLATLAGCAPEPDAEPAAAAEDEAAQEVREPRMSVELVPYPATPDERGHEGMKLRFRNDGNAPGYLLHYPESYNLVEHMPPYTWTWAGPGGATVMSGIRCGGPALAFEARKSLDECLFEVRPGQVWERDQPIRGRSIPVTGVYRVSFEYAYEPRPDKLPLPAKAWRGRMKAAPVEVWLNRQN